VGWAVYYLGGVFTSEDGPPEVAPLDGVQVIIDETSGREIVQGHDYYIWVGKWAGGSQADLERWIRAGYVKPGLVKFGLIIPDPEYREIVGEAM